MSTPAVKADQEHAPRPYSCKLCGRAFRTNRDRRKHIDSTGHVAVPVTQHPRRSTGLENGNISIPLSNLTMGDKAAGHRSGKRSERAFQGEPSSADYKRQKNIQPRNSQSYQPNRDGGIPRKQMVGQSSEWNKNRQATRIESNVLGPPAKASSDSSSAFSSQRNANPKPMVPSNMVSGLPPLFPCLYLDGQSYSGGEIPATSDAAQNVWTTLDIVEHPGAWQVLRPHPRQRLESAGYRVKTYTYDGLKDFKKCRNCGNKAKFHTTPTRKLCFFHPEKRSFTMNGAKERIYQCCGKTQPCQRLPEHEYYDLDKQIKDRYLTLVFTPARTEPCTKRAAVVLDCEMAAIAGGYQELVRFSAVDYFSGEVIIDTHVQPQAHVVDWQTRYSGVSYASMQQAYTRNNVLMRGWREAREELFKHIDADTVLIGHSLDNDLSVLRMLHLQVVDSQILAQECAKVKRQYSLKILCSELVDKKIQTSGKRGHEPLEDCMGTREAVLWMTRNPELFNEWGAQKKREEEVRMAEEKKKRLEEQAKKAAEKARALETEKKKEKDEKEEEGKGYLTDEANERRRETLLDLGLPVEVVGEGHGVLY